MKIARIAELTGVSVATIKYYLHDGLIPRGTATAVNQAQYTDTHVNRVRTIQTLGRACRLPLDLIKRLFRPEAQLPAVMGDVLHDLLVTGRSSGAAEVSLDLVIGRGGVLDLTGVVGKDHPARHAALAALTILQDHGIVFGATDLERYAAAARLVATVDAELYQAPADPETRMRHVLIGTFVGNQLFAALRILAQEVHK